MTKAAMQWIAMRSLGPEEKDSKRPAVKPSGGSPYVTLGCAGVVTAPSAAELTRAAYFANTPVL